MEYYKHQLQLYSELLNNLITEYHETRTKTGKEDYQALDLILRLRDKVSSFIHLITINMNYQEKMDWLDKFHTDNTKPTK